MRRWDGEMVRVEEEKTRNRPPLPQPLCFSVTLLLTVAMATVSLTILSNILRPHSAETSEEVIQQRAQAAEKPEGPPQSSTRWMRLA